MPSSATPSPVNALQVDPGGFPEVGSHITSCCSCATANVASPTAATRTAMPGVSHSPAYHSPSDGVMTDETSPAYSTGSSTG